MHGVLAEEQPGLTIFRRRYQARRKAAPYFLELSQSMTDLGVARGLPISTQIPTPNRLSATIYYTWIHTRAKILLTLQEGLPDTNISISAIPGLLRPIGASAILLALPIVQSRSERPTTARFNGLRFDEVMNGLLHTGFLIKNQKSLNSLRSSNGLVMM